MIYLSFQKYDFLLQISYESLSFLARPILTGGLDGVKKKEKVSMYLSLNVFFMAASVENHGRLMAEQSSFISMLSSMTYLEQKGFSTL